jgi:dihydrofolate reductase
MRKLSAFEFTSLNGFYKGQGNDISWHRHGGEESNYSEEMLEAGNTLLFGRVTYEMMVDYWTSPMAAEQYPVVADGMNKADKIVFSKTLDKVGWNNTRLVKENIVEEMRRMKEMPGKNMNILGSGTIATLFAEAGLLDEIQIMVDPILIGNGTPLFRTVKKNIALQLMATRTFKSGAVILTYKPLKA